MTTLNQSNAQTVATPTVALRELIQKGNFFKTDPRIIEANFGPEHFAIRGNYDNCEFEIVDFEAMDSLGDMMNMLSGRNCVPANLGDGLVFAARDLNNNWKEKDMLLLGSQINLKRTAVAPSMFYTMSFINYWMCEQGRYLNLHRLNWMWDSSQCALGVRFK